MSMSMSNKTTMTMAQVSVRLKMKYEVCMNASICNLPQKCSPHERACKFHWGPSRLQVKGLSVLCLCCFLFCAP